MGLDLNLGVYLAVLWVVAPVLAQLASLPRSPWEMEL